MNKQFEDMFGSNNEGKYVLANVVFFTLLIALAVAIIIR